MSDNPFHVRHAGPQDFEALAELVLFLAREDALQEVSETKMLAALQRCIERDGAIAGVIEGPFGIDATIGLCLDQFPYTDADHLAVRWLGTAPAYRDRVTMKKHRNFRPEDAGFATRLVRFGKWAAEAMDVPLIISVLTAHDLEPKMRSYTRQTPQIGATFGWGALPDRDFHDQVTLAAPAAGGGAEGSPRGSLSSGQVRQPSPV